RPGEANLPGDPGRRREPAAGPGVGPRGRAPPGPPGFRRQPPGGPAALHASQGPVRRTGGGAMTKGPSRGSTLWAPPPPPQKERSMKELLSKVHSPADLHQFTDEQLLQLAQEMRDELVRVLSIRPAHFASNLGVVELCLALHLTFDFSRDRIIWDTGHQ